VSTICVLIFIFAGENIVQKVEDEQRKWRRNVEVQRKNIFTDHTMLN
jgi:hypothetical protein